MLMCTIDKEIDSREIEPARGLLHLFPVDRCFDGVNVHHLERRPCRFEWVRPETGVIDLGPKYQERFAIDGKGVTTVFRFEMRQLLRAELHAERGESAIKAIGIRFTFNSSMSAKQRLARCQIWNMTIHCL